MLFYLSVLMVSIGAAFSAIMASIMLVELISFIYSKTKKD